MSILFQCCILGTPVAKQSDRTAIIGKTKKHIHHYQPKKVVQWADYAKSCIADAWNGKPLIDSKIPLYLDVSFYFPPVTSLRKHEKELLNNHGFIPKITKPDYDNLAKQITDCLQGIVIKNDSQISEAMIRKRMSNHPATHVVLTELR